jgi:transcriptional regulator with XRE-family HTH domain
MASAFLQFILYAFSQEKSIQKEQSVILFYMENGLSSDPLIEILGQRLRQLRELRGLSLTKLATQADAAKSDISKLERGEVHNPGLTTLGRIATVLEVSLPQLLSSPTASHTRPRWSAVIDPLEIERLKEAMAPSLAAFLKVLETEEHGTVPADIVRSLALLQIRGRRPETLENWRFVYEAIRRSVS